MQLAFLGHQRPECLDRGEINCYFFPKTLKKPKPLSLQSNQNLNDITDEIYCLLYTLGHFIKEYTMHTFFQNRCNVLLIAARKQQVHEQSLIYRMLSVIYTLTISIFN